MSDRKSHARPADWRDVLLSPQTHALIDELQDLLAAADPVGERPSKHRAIALALQATITQHRAKAPRRARRK